MGSVARDFYATLGLTKSAQDAQINAAYRRLALRWHPSRHHNTPQLDSAIAIFKEVSNAYAILINPKTRAQYDSVGEDFTKQSVVAALPLELAKAEQVFEAFFGTANPFAGLVEGERELWQSEMTEKMAEPPPIEVECLVTLEELYNGCTKVFKVPRQKVSAAEELVKYDDMITVAVSQGWKDGTKCIFEKDPRDITGKVVFTIKTVPHEDFKRVGDDLLYTAKITLIQSLTGHTFDVRTLDGRLLHVPLDTVVHPKFVKVLVGEGMPKGDGSRGDLRISFDIEFPELLKEEQQTLITFALTLPSNLSQKQKRLMQLALRLPEKGLSEEQTEALKLVVNTIKPLPPP